MNRKKEAKEKEKESKKALSLHPYDDINNWLQGDFQAPPWPKEKIAEFQKKLDSAFGAENAIVLVWSGDRSYGDEFYTDWHYNGLPKGRLERKPVLLFREFQVNERDYVYVTAPRWLLMEVNHGSQLKAGWESSAWVSDPSMFGGKKRIRAAEPPQYFYTHLKTLATHEGGSPPYCCQRMWEEFRSICYGHYREPDESDIAYVGEIRKNMDRHGVSQRNDTVRDPNVVLQAGLAAKHYIRRAEQQKAQATKEFMLARPQAFFGDIVKRKGGTMSARELEETVKGALDAQDEERFS